MKTRLRHSLETGLPDDLCTWVSPALLRSWIEELMESLDWDNPDVQALLRANPEFRPQVALRVLTLAYAKGMTESRRIADACAEEAEFRQACGPEAPSADDLILFREKNRPLLERMLEELMKRAVQERFDCTLLPQPVKKYIAHLSSLRLDFAELEDRRLLAA